MMMNPISLLEKAKLITEYWSPHIVARLNGQLLKLAKIKGEFIWHSHENEDELFWVLSGEMKIAFRTHEIVVKTGEIALVPKGIEHKPTAENECIIALFEPESTLNTGEIVNERTKHTLKEL